MTKTFHYLLMMLTAVVLTACSQSRLKNAIEAENSLCPHEIEEGLTLNKVELMDGNTAAFYFKVFVDDDIALDDVELKEALAELLPGYFTDGDWSFDDIVDAVIEADGRIACYFEDTMGNEWKCELPAFQLSVAKAKYGSNDEDDDESDNLDLDEIDDISDIEYSDRNLELLLSEARESLPNDLGDGMVMSEIKSTEKDLVFTILCDDDYIDVSLLEEARDEMKSVLIDMLAEGDDDIKTLGKVAIWANRGLMFKYEGDPSGKVFKVRISPAEAKKALGL